MKRKLTLFVLLVVVLIMACTPPSFPSKVRLTPTPLATVTPLTDCPNPPLVNLSTTIPEDVCIPSNFQGNPIAFFDDFSWRSFVALVWPALNGQRGMADTTLTVNDSGARVFETLKASWEIFHPDGSAPVTWNQYDIASTNACSATVGFGDLVLASFSKFGDIGQAGFGSLVGPLVAQNTTYVRYLTGFNQIEFDQISTNQWYLRKNLSGTMTFPNGSLDVKSSWIEMTNIPHPERYYTRMALVLDPATGECTQKVVGLVGLHIVQKTPSRPQWIWSTFEQVDNVPPAQPGAPGTFGFNNGSSTPMPAVNPYPINPLQLPVPAPFNVQRVKPIHSSTQQTNQAYQQALTQQNQNSVWQFYQLVMTQWPLQPDSPNTPGTPPNTFPGSGSDQTSFSNTTMETFDQKSITTGCMACHNFTKQKTDFLWTLNDHAFPPAVPNLLMREQPFRQLRELLQEQKEQR